MKGFERHAAWKELAAANRQRTTIRKMTAMGFFWDAGQWRHENGVVIQRVEPTIHQTIVHYRAWATRYGDKRLIGARGHERKYVYPEAAGASALREWFSR